MSLKTDYFDGATGLHDQMNDVFDQGVALVVANSITISDELKNNAAKGLTVFTITLAAAFEPSNLRLKGLHQSRYFAGIVSGMSVEDIYSDEVNVTLNESDQSQLKIDLNFTL